MTESLLTEIAKTVPVLLGGVLAILGGFGSQLLVHRLADKRERAKVRREKLEALVKAVYAHGHWIEEKQTRMVFKNEDHDVLSPLDEARMLQALHFPELASELIAVQRAQLPLVQFVSEQRIKHMKSKEAFIEEWNPAAFNEAYKHYLAATGALVAKARSLLGAQ
jgi:hypothetical protein